MLSFHPPSIPQSTETPFVLKSAFARSISFKSSACAAGTSLNVKTPNPNLNRRYAPNETSAQNGSYHVALVLLFKDMFESSVTDR